MAAIEVKGVKLDIGPEALDDIDVIEAIADLNSADADGAAEMAAVVRLMRTVFGDDWERIKRELRVANGGRLGMAALGEFFNGVCEALGKQAKN